MEHISEVISKAGTPKEILNKIAVNIPAENTDTLSNTNCLHCKGCGFVHPCVEGVIDYSRVIPCSCREQELTEQRKESLLKHCELPPMAQEMSLENFEVYPAVKEAYDIAWEVSQNPSQLAWLTFMGSNDTGKTHLAISICRSWLEKGIPAKYALVSLLLDELREGFNRPIEDNYSVRFRRLCNVPLLILDDLGVESSTPWVQEKLETLIDYRYMNKLSLVVTTNKALDEMSLRIRSRLVRHPSAKVVAIIAEEYTMRKTQGH